MASYLAHIVRAAIGIPSVAPFALTRQPNLPLPPQPAFAVPSMPEEGVDVIAQTAQGAADLPPLDHSAQIARPSPQAGAVPSMPEGGADVIAQASQGTADLPHLDHSVQVARPSPHVSAPPLVLPTERLPFIAAPVLQNSPHSQGISGQTPVTLSESGARQEQDKSISPAQPQSHTESDRPQEEPRLDVRQSVGTAIQLAASPVAPHVEPRAPARVDASDPFRLIRDQDTRAGNAPTRGTVSKPAARMPPSGDESSFPLPPSRPEPVPPLMRIARQQLAGAAIQSDQPVAARPVEGNSKPTTPALDDQLAQPAMRPRPIVMPPPQTMAHADSAIAPPARAIASSPLPITPRAPGSPSAIQARSSADREIGLTIGQIDVTVTNQPALPPFRATRPPERSRPSEAIHDEAWLARRGLAWLGLKP